MNIDAEIAEKLFEKKLFFAGSTYRHEDDHARVFPWSEAYAGVVPILEALRKKGFVVEIEYNTVAGEAKCYVLIHDHVRDFRHHVVEGSLPLALCKAALLALGEKVE